MHVKFKLKSACAKTESKLLTIGSSGASLTIDGESIEPIAQIDSCQVFSVFQRTSCHGGGSAISDEQSAPHPSQPHMLALPLTNTTHTHQHTSALSLSHLLHSVEHKNREQEERGEREKRRRGRRRPTHPRRRPKMSSTTSSTTSAPPKSSPMASYNILENHRSKNPNFKNFS